MSEILTKTVAFVVDLFSTKLDPKYLYHNLKHTQRVVNSTSELAEAHILNDHEKEILLLAAWLHDTGYTKGSGEHEKSSCEIAREFLENEGYDKDGIKNVQACIMATRRYYEPQGLSEQIIRDADASHFAQKSYLETCELLREELSQLGIADYSFKEWMEVNIQMFRTEHRYYTDYAKANWQERKDKNLMILVKELKKDKQIAKREQLKAKYKNESPDRGIQTLFRVTIKNHITLSDIADTKANILLSVNAIIISVVLSNLLPKLDNPSNTYLIYPTLIFLIFTVTSMVMAVIATRPNISGGKFSKTDVSDKKVNLLFFGNFHKMKLEEYEWAIKELVKDKEYIYSSLTKDLYYLGLVLNRKYRILRLTYTIFAVGIIVSVIAFTFAFGYLGKGYNADVASLLGF
jgi:predicted metal-dependent HD superfamily phosphohydrolase